MSKDKSELRKMIEEIETIDNRERGDLLTLDIANPKSLKIVVVSRL